jgi:hypothetical protein
MNTMKLTALGVALALLSPAIGWGAGPSVLTAAQAAGGRIEKVSLDGVTLDVAIRQFQQVTGVPIDADWDALSQVGVTGESRTKVIGRDLTCAQVLDVMLASVEGKTAPLSWYTSSKGFRITSQSEVLGMRGVGRPLRSLTVRPTTRPALTTQAAPAMATPATPPAPTRVTAAPAPTPRRTRFIPSLKFEDTPISDAMDFFRNATGLNTVVNWKSLELVGVTKTSPVSIDLRDVEFGKAMDLVLDNFNAGKGTFERLYWLLDEGVLTVATGAVFNEEMIVRVMDVSDLLMSVPDFVGPTDSFVQSSSSTSGTTSGTGYTSGGLGASTGTVMTGASLGVSAGQSGTSSGAGQSTSSADLRARAEQSLIAVVRSTIPDEFWEPNGKGSIRILRGQMIISQSKLGFKLMNRSSRR